MLRFFATSIALFALSYCLVSTAVLSCMAFRCGENAAQSCSIGSIYEKPSPCSPFDNCQKPSGNSNSGNTSGGGGCCICTPNCCVYLVPEVRYDLFLTVLPDEWLVRAFAEPDFFRQSVDFSVWRPPAVA